MEGTEADYERAKVSKCRGAIVCPPPLALPGQLVVWDLLHPPHPERLGCFAFGLSRPTCECDE